MKRSLFFALCFLAAKGLNAQYIPHFNDYLPYHTFLHGHKPDVEQARGAYQNQSKNYTGTFVIAAKHYTNGVNGWNIQDSSTYNYEDSLPFPIADTILAYVASNQSWAYDSEFSVTSYYLPGYFINDQDSFYTSRTGQVYNTGTSTWSNTYQYSLIYDTFGRATSVVYLTWSGSAWDSISKTTHGFYDSGMDSALSLYSYAGNSWQNDTQYLYIYNSLGQDSQVIVQVGNGSSWVNFQQYNYQYAPISNVFTGININSWNGTGWTPYGIYTYSRNNSQASYLLQLYNSGQYVNSYEETFALDYRGNVLTFENFSFSNNVATPLVQYIYTYDINNDVTFEQDAFWSNGSYNPTDQYYYYYEWFYVVGAINDVGNELSAGIYPNPSTGDANLSYNTTTPSQLNILVLDEQGRKVSGMSMATNAGSNIFPLQLSGLAPGNYLVYLSDVQSGKTATLKFVKQ